MNSLNFETISNVYKELNEKTLEVKEIEKIAGVGIKELIIRLKEGSIKIINFEYEKNYDLDFLSLRQRLYFHGILLNEKEGFEIIINNEVIGSILEMKGEFVTWKYSGNDEIHRQTAGMFLKIMKERKAFGC